MDLSGHCCVLLDIVMVIRVHVLRCVTKILWTFFGESDGMWWGLSGTLDMDIGCGSSAQ